MPRFTAIQKKTIQHRLRTTGKTLFAQQGLKRTSLDQLTAETGIAKSTFYAFFDSKEHLYLDLLEDEAEEMEERVWGQVLAVPDTRSALITYMKTMTIELEQNLLTKRLLTDQSEARLISDRVTPAIIARKTRRNIEPLINYIQEKQKGGEIIREEPEVLVGVMRAAMTTVVHKHDYHTANAYHQTQRLLFEAVADKLTNI